MTTVFRDIAVVTPKGAPDTGDAGSQLLDSKTVKVALGSPPQLPSANEDGLGGKAAGANSSQTHHQTLPMVRTTIMLSQRMDLS